MSRTISRRTLLKGAGAAVGLPLLEAMGAPLIAQSKPVRMAFLYMANGVHPNAWTPKEIGKDFQLTPVLEPLAKVRQDLLVLTELWNAGANSGDGHYVKTGGWLTGTTITKTTGSDLRSGGVSMDQLAAQNVGNLTPLPSLELGTQNGAQSGNCDSGYSCAYSSNISWRTPSSPMAKEINPRALFIRMFGDPKARSSEAEIAREATYTRSILDMVLEDSKRLKTRIGVTDQAKLDEYLEGVRGIEKQIQGVEKIAAATPPSMELPTSIPQDHGAHLRLMFDLLAAAFQTDTTRVATFMLANSGSNNTFPGIGVTEGHHTLSHHASAKDKLDKIKKIDTFYAEQFSYFLQKLHAVKEERGTILDNSMIVYGGAISDGNRHNHDDLPVILAGKGGGTIASGRFVKMSGQPMCNLFLAMFARAKVKAVGFGDGTRPLAI